MKKKFFALVGIAVFAIFSLFPENYTISDKRAVMLINYLQYSLVQVKENPNSLVANQEFDNIINNINSTTLKDQDIIDEHGKILNTFTNIKLLDEQKKHAEEMAAKQRKMAFTQLFNTPGAFFAPGANPIASIIYAATSAGLNYAGTLAQINNKKDQQLFELNQGITRQIDTERQSLYTTSARVFKNRADNNSLVIEQVMKDFIQAVKLNNINARYERLQSLKYSLNSFPPYWLALGYASQLKGDFSIALDCYAKYENMMKTENILNYDDFLCQINFNKLSLYRDLGYSSSSSEVNACINTILSEIKSANIETKVKTYYDLGVVFSLFGDTSKYEYYMNEAQKHHLGNWNDTVTAYKTQYKAFVGQQNSELISYYFDLVKNDCVARAKNVKNLAKDINFYESSKGGLSINAYKLPFSAEVYTQIGDKVYGPAKSKSRNLWDDVLSYEQLTEKKTGLFSGDNKYYFSIDGEDFRLWLYAGIGFWADNGISKFKLVKNNKKGVDLKIDYRNLYLTNIPSYSTYMAKNSDAKKFINQSLADKEIKDLLLNSRSAKCNVYDIDSSTSTFWFYPDQTKEYCKDFKIKLR